MTGQFSSVCCTRPGVSGEPEVLLVLFGELAEGGNTTGDRSTPPMIAANSACQLGRDMADEYLIGD